jgi:hypothetical protein
MKPVLNIFIVILAALSFAACEKASNPVSPVSVDKTAQNNSGTFEVTYKDYKNSSRTVSLSGTINFNFGTDTYSYDGVIVSTDNELSGPVHDNGTYVIRGNYIEMFDNAAKQMNPVWQPSLYLSGTYTYRRDTQVTIDGEGEYGSIRIILNVQ